MPSRYSVNTPHRHILKNRVYILLQDWLFVGKHNELIAYTITDFTISKSNKIKVKSYRLQSFISRENNTPNHVLPIGIELFQFMRIHHLRPMKYMKWIMNVDSIDEESIKF